MPVMSEGPSAPPVHMIQLTETREITCTSGCIRMKKGEPKRHVPASATACSSISLGECGHVSGPLSGPGQPQRIRPRHLRAAGDALDRGLCT